MLSIMLQQQLQPAQASTPRFEMPVRSKAIQARKVNMTFGTGAGSYRVLKDIDLDVCRGDIQLLMGPSGSGKTTLLSILAGLLQPTSGSVSLLGREITRMSRVQLSRFRLEHVGFIFQSFNLFSALSAVENVEVVLNLKGVRGSIVRREALQLLERVGLKEYVDRLPKQLSGGQKQRVAIARALAGNPSILMADEPTASLDSQSGYATIELLRSLAKEWGSTVLIVTHDPRICDVADRVVHLEDGRIKSYA